MVGGRLPRSAGLREKKERERERERKRESKRRGAGGRRESMALMIRMGLIKQIVIVMRLILLIRQNEIVIVIIKISSGF